MAAIFMFAGFIGKMVMKVVVIIQSSGKADLYIDVWYAEPACNLNKEEMSTILTPEPGDNVQPHNASIEPNKGNLDDRGCETVRAARHGWERCSPAIL